MAKSSYMDLRNKIIKIDRRILIQFKTNEAREIWYNWVEENSDDLELINYTRRWAKYMQHLIHEKHRQLSEIAYQTSLDCDINDCIGHEEYSVALDILIRCWIYGDNLEIYASKY